MTHGTGIIIEMARFTKKGRLTQFAEPLSEAAQWLESQGWKQSEKSSSFCEKKAQNQEPIDEFELMDDALMRDPDTIAGIAAQVKKEEESDAAARLLVTPLPALVKCSRCQGGGEDGPGVVCAFCLGKGVRRPYIAKEAICANCKTAIVQWEARPEASYNHIETGLSRCPDKFQSETLFATPSAFTDGSMGMMIPTRKYDHE